MPLVDFTGHGAVEAPRGATILEAARLAGVVIESPCGGAGVCGKCKVRVGLYGTSSAKSATDLDGTSNVKSPSNHVLSESERKQGYVLSCVTEVLGDITVFLESREDNASLQILSSGKEAELSLNPYITKRYDSNSG